MDLVLNPESLARITALKARLPHALLLTGPVGIGLGTIAANIAGSDQEGVLSPVNSKGDKDVRAGTIPVEAVRSLYEQTRGKKLSRGVVIIDDADRMSHGAQAALLKLLEEPPGNTHFILTSHSPQLILPTVRSRLQTLEISPVTENQTEELLARLRVSDDKKRTQLKYLATGRPAELIRLAADDSYFAAVAETVADARVLLTGSVYQKLLIVHKYQPDKSQSIRLIDTTIEIARRTVSEKPQPSLIQQIDQLLEVREKIRQELQRPLTNDDFCATISLFMLAIFLLAVLGAWALFDQRSTGVIGGDITQKLSSKLDQLWDIAQQSLRKRKYLRAEKALLTILRVDERNATAYNRLGILYAQQKAYEDAIECFEIAQSLEPSASSLHNVGLIYYETKSYEKAALAFEQAIAMEGDLAARYIAYAKVLEKLERPGKMIAALERAVEIEPVPQTLNILADAYEQNGRPDEATDLREKAARMQLKESTPQKVVHPSRRVMM